MIYAVFSDIHGKSENLEIFLKKLSEYRIDNYICLGDSLDEPPDVIFYTDLLMNRMQSFIVKGNTDKILISKYMYFYKKGSMEYDAIHRFAALPEFIVHDNFVMCHSSLVSENKYIQKKKDVNPELGRMKKRKVKIMFHGHTHIPQMFIYYPGNSEIQQVNGNDLYKDFIDLDDNNFYIINPGSVGSPRGGSSPGFLIFDSEKLQIKFIRF